MALFEFVCEICEQIMQVEMSKQESQKAVYCPSCGSQMIPGYYDESKDLEDYSLEENTEEV